MKRKIDPKIITNINEYPSSDQPYHARTNLNSKEIKEKWIYIKKKLLNSSLRERYGFDKDDMLASANVMRILINYMYEKFKKEDIQFKNNIKKMEAQNLQKEIELFFDSSKFKKWREQI